MLNKRPSPQQGKIEHDTGFSVETKKEMRHEETKRRWTTEKERSQ